MFIVFFPSPFRVGRSFVPFLFHVERLTVSTLHCFTWNTTFHVVSRGTHNKHVTH